MQLNIVVQNLGHGGLKDGDGNPDDRWPQLTERINGAADRVDVVMLCEANGWDLYGHKQLARAMADLDLDAAPLALSRSGYGTALLYRREVLGRWARHNLDFGTEALHGLAVTSFDVGLPAPLSFLPVHFTPFAAEQALIEANYAATRAYRYGPYAVLGGDVNYPPAASDHPLPDYAEMRPYNVGSRTLLPRSDMSASHDLEPDRRVTGKLVHNGFHDVAWLAGTCRGSGMNRPRYRTLVSWTANLIFSRRTGRGSNLGRCVLAGVGDGPGQQGPMVFVGRWRGLLVSPEEVTAAARCCPSTRASWSLSSRTSASS